MTRLKTLKHAYENQIRILTGLKEERTNRLKKGDSFNLVLLRW